MEREEAGKEMESLMKDFSGNHIGQAYSSSSTPDKYSDGDTGGELHRVTWASSWYGYLQSKGYEASKAPVWDKPIWSTYDESTGKNSGFVMSIFEVGKIGVSIALTATGAGALVAAAINAGVAIGHDLLNVAAGSLDMANFGLNTMKNLISGAAGMLTAGIGADKALGQFMDTGSKLGNGLLTAGISSTANLATTGLKLNANGQMDWSLNQQQWANFGVNTLQQFGQAAFNTGISWNKNDMFSMAGQAAGNWAINSTAALVNKGWKQNASGGLDWQLDENKGEWSEALMDAGTSGIKSGLNYAFGADSYLSYAMGKGLDMAKYGMMQSGMVGQNGSAVEYLKNKYAGDNVFNLAGGMDLTFFMGNNTNTGAYNGAASLQFNTKGFRLHEGVGEFNGLAFMGGSSMAGSAGLGWNGINTWNNTMKNFSDIGNFLSYDQAESNFVDFTSIEESDNSGAPSAAVKTMWLTKTNKMFLGMFKISEKSTYFNENAPQQENKLWDKILGKDSTPEQKEEALKELMSDFLQTVTTNEDATDKTQRAVLSILKGVNSGQFGMGIKGQLADQLKQILNTHNTNGFNQFVSTMVSSTNDWAMQAGYKSYLNGLRYMADNQDTAAVYMQSESCALISSYFLGALNGKFDPRKVSYNDFYKTQFEHGLISPGTRDPWPVNAVSFGYTNQAVNVAILNATGSVGGTNIFIRESADFAHQDVNQPINSTGMTQAEIQAKMNSSEWSSLSAQAKKTYNDINDAVNKFDYYLNKLYESTSTTQWYMVQRKDNYGYTHFFMMGNYGGGDLRVYDHNWKFQSSYQFGQQYSPDNHNLYKFIWY